MKSLDNFIDKIKAFCENPIIFIYYPITEDHVKLFSNTQSALSESHKQLKSSLYHIVPDLFLLEVKLVPSFMSLKKYYYILFLVTSDYPFLDQNHCGSLSTNDEPLPEKTLYEPSQFLRNYIKDTEFKDSFFLELSENLAEAFSHCELINDFPLFD